MAMSEENICFPMQLFYVYQARFMVHAQYMFAAQCRSENVDQVTKFLHIVPNTDWNVSPPLDNDGAT
jgi:predicted nucleotide-binding protein (sugar kinase/HSP70/actin superfamily)